MAVNYTDEVETTDPSFTDTDTDNNINSNNNSDESSDESDETALVKSCEHPRLTGLMAVKHVGSNLSLTGLRSVKHAGSNLSLAGLKVMKQAGSSLSLTARHAGSNISLTAHKIVENGSNLVRKISKHALDGYSVMNEDDTDKDASTVGGSKETNEDRHIMDIERADSQPNLNADYLGDEVVVQPDDSETTEKTKKKKRMKLSVPRDSLSQIEACFNKLRASITTLKLRKRKQDLEEEVGIMDEEPKRKIVRRRKNRANMFLMQIFTRIQAARRGKAKD